MDSILTKHPMIEVFSLDRKETIYYFNAYCHSCKTEFKRSTAQMLSKHCASLVHDRRLNLRDNMTEGEVKEQARRQLILSNKKFTSFLEVRKEESLWCKWCSVQLQYSYDKVTAHRYTIKHMSNAEEETEEPQFTEEIKLKKLHKLVNMFPDFLALVTDFDKRINDEIFEYYKTPDQITLQVNDLYCKPCRRKLTRANFRSLHKSVAEHFKSKKHKAEVEKQLAAVGSNGEKMRAALEPPKKICVRRHDQADLRELARASVEANLPIFQSGRSMRNVVLSTIHRPASSAAMKLGVELLNNGNCCFCCLLYFSNTKLFRFPQRHASTC